MTLLSAIPGEVGQVIGVVQRQGQLDGFRDQLILDALLQAWGVANKAAKGITDEAEAIFTQAEICRIDNDDDAHAVCVRIANYFKNHPRLTVLNEALPVVRTLLEALEKRAGRFLLLPGKRRKRREVVERFLANAKEAEEFAANLYFEFEYLPTRTGLAKNQLVSIEEIMKEDRKVRRSQVAELSEHIAKGRAEVGASRLRQAAMGFGTVLADAKVAFL